MARERWREAMHRAWRAARDLSTALAVLALLQLALSLALVGTPSAGMLAAQVALAVVLAAIALMAHVRLQGELARPSKK